MADEEQKWTNLSFEIDQEGNAKPVEAPEAETPKDETIVEQAAEGETPEVEERKRASRTDRLKRQRDREAQGRLAAEQRAQELEQRLAQLEGAAASTGRTTLTVTKKALEDKLAQASQTFQDAFERGDKVALLQAQRAMTEAEIDLRTVGSSLEAIPEKPAPVRQIAPQRPQVADPSESTQEWIEENKWFNKDKAMRGFALGVHEQLLEDGIEPESPEYFEAITNAVKEQFGEERMGGKKATTPAPVRKPPPVGGQGHRAPTGKVTLTKEDLSAASRMGVTPVEYAKQKARIDATGYDPSSRDNEYVTIL